MLRVGCLGACTAALVGCSSGSSGGSDARRADDLILDRTGDPVPDSSARNDTGDAAPTASDAPPKQTDGAPGDATDLLPAAGDAADQRSTDDADVSPPLADASPDGSNDTSTATGDADTRTPDAPADSRGAGDLSPDLLIDRPTDGPPPDRPQDLALAPEAGADGQAPDGPGPQASAICSADHWCWENPTPQGHALSAVWTAPSGDVWVVGMYGTILRYQGGQWSRAASGSDALVLSGIWGSADDDIWVVGSAGTILHFDGAAWAKVSSPTTQSLAAIWGSGPGNAWAVGWAGTIVHLSGTTWSVAPGPAGVTDTLTSVWGSSPTDVWAVGGQERILHFDGSSWSSVVSTPSAGNLMAVCGTSATSVWAVGATSIGTGMVDHFDGTRWQGSTGYISDPIDGIWCSPGGDGWAVGHQDLGTASTVWRLGASGLTPTLTGIAGVFNALGGRDAGSVWAAGSGGALMHWDGSSWSRASSTVVDEVFFYGAFVPGPNDAWAVGSRGTILHFNGTTWAQVPSSTSVDLLAIHGSGPGDLWAGGANRTLLHSSGQGFQAFSPSPPVGGGNAFMAAIWASAPDDVWVAVDDPNVADQVAIAHFDGAAWQITHTPSGTSSIWALWSPAPGDVWALGGLAAHWNGSAWVKVPTEAGGTGLAMWGASANDAWLVGYAGSIQHWNGSAFSQVPSPTDQDLRAIAGKSASDIYATGANGAIVHFDGSTWKAESADTAIELRAIAFTGSNDVQLFSDQTAIFLKHRP